MRKDIPARAATPLGKEGFPPSVASTPRGIRAPSLRYPRPTAWLEPVTACSVNLPQGALLLLKPAWVFAPTPRLRGRTATSSCAATGAAASRSGKPEEMMDEPERGKRSGSGTRKRGSIIGFRALDAERAEIDEAAERVGLTRSSYVRACTLKAPKTRAMPRPSIERELMSQAVAFLGRATGNLHQIAKHLNFGNVEYAADAPAAIAECRAAVAMVMKAAGRTPRVPSVGCDPRGGRVSKDDAG
jgi:hypothetical protein